MKDSISEQESLAIIQEMIQKGKRNIKEGSVYYLIWGWAVLTAGLIEFALITVVDSNWHWLTWPVGMVAAGVISAIVGSKQVKNKRYITFTDIAMKYIWIGFVTYLFVVLFMSIVIGWAASYALIIGLYGLGTFISGGVLQFRPLIIGGILSLALSALSLMFYETFSHFPNMLLLLCVSIVVSYLIPGYMLRAKP